MDKMVETKDSVTYRFSCSCYVPEHTLDVKIQKDWPNDITVYVYSTPSDFKQRLKWAWKMLRTGEGFEHDFVFREEDVPELQKIVAQSVSTQPAHLKNLNPLPLEANT